MTDIKITTGPNIYQRMRGVMQDVVGVGKHQRNTHGGFNYAGHEAVTAALRGAYVKHGIHRSASVLDEHRDGGMLRLRVEVRWTNVDNPEDSHAVVTLGESPSVTKSGAPSPVQSGIAFSYAVKNAEFKVFALTGDDTPDAEEDEGRAPQTRAEPVRHGPSFEIDPLIRGFRDAASEQQLAAATAEVKKVSGQLSEPQRELLTKEWEVAEARLRGAG